MAPFAGFEDFSECTRVMTEEEGHDQSAAERICGALQDEAKSEHGNVEELKDALARGRGLIADVGVDLNSAVDQPAINSKWTMFKSTESEGHDTKIDAPLVLKQDDGAEKRIAYAPAMIPREVDKEGDVVPTPTVEKAAHDYLKNDGGVDSDHDLIDGKGEPVESWIEPSERTWDLPDGDTETYPAGTWMVGIEWDAKTWDRIQSGELEGLSIYGKADHVPLAKSEEGATPKNDAGESSEQDSIMSDSDTDVGSRLDTVEASVSEVKEAVESIKEEVSSTDKQPDGPDGDAGSVMRDAAQLLANHDDVSGNTDEIASDLKSMFLSSKEDGEDMGDGMDDEEDDEGEMESESSEDEEEKSETEKSEDSEPNFGKTEDGGESASVAKDAQGTAGSGGVPSYRAAAENEGDL